jgi:HEXXH motif-containing protein
VITHQLPEKAFARLAAGEGDQFVVGELRQAQQSKHTMLLHAIAEAAGHADGVEAYPAAFRAAYELLTQIQATSHATFAWLLALPHLGGWAHDTLLRLDQGPTPDFAYLASLAGAAAVRAGLPFDIDVPLRDGGVLLPGLGRLGIADGPDQGQPDEFGGSWIRLRGDGEQVTVGGGPPLPRSALGPDDGTGSAVPNWRGTPVVRAIANGLAWEVLLVTDDAYLDRYHRPMSAGLPPDEVGHWRERIQSAWEVLVCHHQWAARPIAAGVSAMVPLTPSAGTGLISATSPATFGAIATSWPPDPVTLAETLVHEFHHVLLYSLMDMVPLISSAGEQVYAPWRPDPRPAAGLLQGVYAHLGVVRFWQAQRLAETAPDDQLRAQAQYARWRPAIDLAVDTLQRTGCLTPAGARFISLLGAKGRELADGTVPRPADEMAAEATLDHWLTWQMRHMAVDRAAAARLAAAYRHGDPPPAGRRPGSWISEDVRKLGSDVRSRLLSLRYLDPAGYRELAADGALPLSAADRRLLSQDTAFAIDAYRTQIGGTADPQPDAWVGLALGLHRLPSSPLRDSFAAWLPVLFEVHACLGVPADPLDLAGWFR